MRYIDRLRGSCPCCRWSVDSHNDDCDGTWWTQILAAIGQAPVLALIDRVERGEIEARPDGAWDPWSHVTYRLGRWEIEVYLDGPGSVQGFGDWHYLERVAFDGVSIEYMAMPCLVGNYVPDDDCEARWNDIGWLALADSKKAYTPIGAGMWAEIRRRFGGASRTG